MKFLLCRSCFDIIFSRIMKYENITWKTLLKWKKNDLYVCGSSVLSIIFIWIYLFFNESLTNILTYNNANEYIEVAQHFYFVSNDKGKFDSNLLRKARILPVTPICLYIFHFLTFGNWTLAAFLYITITAFLASFLFYRFLFVFNLTTKMMTYYYAIALSIHPISYIIYRSVVNSDSLYLCFMFIALISFRISYFKTALVSTFLALLTNNQGIVLYLSICCYLLFENPKYNNKICNFLLLFPVAFILLGIIHYFSMQNFFAYFSQEFIHSNEYCPYGAIFLSCTEVDKLWVFHGNFVYYMLGFFGILFLSVKSIFLAFHLTVSFVFLIFVKYDYIFQKGIQFEIFVLLGLDDFMSSKNVRKILPIFSIIYGITGHLISMQSIDYS